MALSTGRGSSRTGKGLKISVTFVDSGGHYTQEVYENCRKRLMKRVFCGQRTKRGRRAVYRVPSKAKIMKDGAVKTPLTEKSPRP